MTEKKKGLKHQVSYKENIRDIAIYDYVENQIKNREGVSQYYKMLAEKDMREKGIWKWD